MRRNSQRIHNGERGQALIVMVLTMTVLLGMAALAIDVGLFLTERSRMQSAADAAALAGAQELPSSLLAETAALEWAGKNGFTDGQNGTSVDVITPYSGNSGQVEVVISSEASFMFGRVLGKESLTIRTRAVAEGPGGVVDGGSDSNPLPPATVPTVDCGSPTVDGRVTASDGYTKLGDLVGGSTDYGDVFVACDANFYYFAMRLNGPSTGGGVANENVYGPKAEKNGPPGYNDVYQTGWSKHDFGALKNSDRARFQIACDGVARHDFIQDYLREDGSDWASDAAGDGEVVVAGPAASASSLEWNLEHPVETGWGDDPGEVPFVPGDKKKGQSPPFNPLYPNYDAQYDGWIWEMIYEFSVPKSSYSSCGGSIFFALHDFVGSAGPLEGIHSSPAKVAEGITLLIESTVIRLIE